MDHVVNKSGNEIIDRNEIVDQVENSENHFKILFEYAPDTIFLLNMKGRILDGNLVAEKLTGYRVKELVGRYITEIDLVSRKHIPKVIKNIAKSAIGLPTGPDEYLLCRNDGSLVDVEVRTYPVTIDNETQILGIARDITERKKTDSKLKETVKELEDFYRMAVNRELKMKELKDEIAELKKELIEYKGDNGKK